MGTKAKKEAEKEKHELAESLSNLTKELENLKIEKQTKKSQIAEEQQSLKLKILTRDNAKLVEDINSAWKFVDEVKSQKKKEITELQTKNQELEKVLLEK